MTRNNEKTSRKSAMDFLARREHSKQELLRKLVDKGFARDEALKAIYELEHEGLQSDARFTDAYVHMRINRGYGPLRIQMELQERGVDSEIIQRALDFDKEYWFDRAVKACNKKNGTEIQKMRYLQYKGFAVDVICRVCRDNKI